MSDGIGAMLLEKAEEALVVAQVAFDQLEVGMGAQVAQVTLFMGAIVIGVEVIEPDHLVATVEQRLRQPRPDKPRRSRHHDTHARLSGEKT